MSNTVYNTYVGALEYGITFSRNTLYINLAPLLPGVQVKANQITAGMKLYNWDKSLYFSINIGECMKILTWWEQGQHETNIHLYHKGGATMDVHKYKDKYYITLAKSKDERVQMPLTLDDLKVFLKTCAWMTTNMVATADMLKEMGKINAGRSSFNPGNDKNGKPYEKNDNYSGGYQKQQYNQNAPQPPLPQPAPQQNYGQPAPQPTSGYQTNNPPVPAPVPQPAPQPSAPAPINNSIDNLSI